MTDNYDETAVVATVRIDGLARGRDFQETKNDFKRQLDEAFDSEMNTLSVESLQFEICHPANDLRSDGVGPED